MRGVFATYEKLVYELGISMDVARKLAQHIHRSPQAVLAEIERQEDRGHETTALIRRTPHGT